MRRRTAFQISGAVQLRRRTFSQPPSPIRFARSRQASTRPCTFERVANEVDNDVSVIDTATNMVVATVPMGDDPRGVAVTPDGKQTCHPADPGDAGRPWLEDAQRVGTPFPPRDLD